MAARDDEQAFEALTDCLACNTESAAVELIVQREGATEGTVLERRCRLCLREEKDGALLFAGESLRTIDRARAALARWAAADGDPDPGRFVLAHFSGSTIDEVAARLARGERVETSFDAVAWLFPGAGSASGAPSTTPPSEERAPPEPEPGALPYAHKTIPDAVMRSTSLVPPMRVAATVPEHKDPVRVAARALAAVMLGDGEITEPERVFVARTLAGWGHPPLRDDDIAPWRPHELGWPHDPLAVVEAMARATYADGRRDASEWRVVREFARAWGVSLERLEAFGEQLDREHQRGMQKLLTQLSSLFIR